MNKQYGFRGQITPEAAAKDLSDNLKIEGIEILIKDGIFEVGYDDPSQEVHAHEVAERLIDSWRFRNNIKINVNFNHTWRPGATGQFHSISISESIHVTDRVVVSTVQIQGKASIISPEFDSYSFSNDIEMAKKSMKDPVLAEALRYYGEEVVDDARPLYGIYKALEVITKKLGKEGRKILAELTGNNEKYVNDVMETAQVQRHAIHLGRRKLSDQECKERAGMLIKAYSSSIKG